MMKKFIKILPSVLISSVILVAGYVVVKACAGGDWGDGYDSNFAPEAFVDSAYTPFFYSGLFYYDINFDDAHLTRFNDENTKEWQSYLGNDMDSNDISFLLNKASLSTILKSKQETTKQKEFVAYLKTAKACESFAATEVSGWYNPEDVKPKIKPPDVNADRLEIDINNSKNKFLKERYWFQLVRYNFFFEPASCIASFEVNKQNYEHNVMYFRTMAYAAGAYYKQKNYAKANYYYSLVFAGNDALKTVAHWSFHPQNENDWNATLNLCTTNEERITLWQMLGIFYADEQRSINEIYKLDPANKAIDLLLTRTINKFESIDQSNEQTTDRLFVWCKKIADEQKIANPFLWNVTTGYLAYLSGDYNQAKAYYDKANQHLPKTELATQQLRLMRLLTQVNSLSKISTIDETKLLPELKWLFFEKSKVPALRTYLAEDLVKKALANKYKSQRDLVKAECFVTNQDFYASVQNVMNLITFLDKTEVSEYDKLCKEISNKKQSDLWEYLAIKAAYSNNLSQASTLMSQAGAAGSSQLLGNPFNARINDCHDCDHQMKQKTKYTKHDLIHKLQEMEANIENKNDVYNNSLLVANAFYNMSYFGNARYFYEGKVIGEGYSDAAEIDTVFFGIVTNMNMAKKYYQISIQHASTDEQKAKSLYLLSKCERNEWYNAVIYPSGESDPYYNNRKVDFIKWNSFYALASYKNTQYYKDVIAECGYFSTATK